MTPVARICRTPGCSTLTDGRFYCHVHTKHRDGRGTRSWERFSREVISRTNGHCQLGYEGCTGTAKHAHKIGKGEHVLDHNQYQAACPHCHQMLHAGYGDLLNP